MEIIQVKNKNKTSKIINIKKLLIIQYIINNFFMECDNMQFKNAYKRLFNKVLSRIDKTDLTYDEAIEIYNRENAMIIDVRSPEEYFEKHLKGAINIPIYEADNIITEIQDKDEVILLYCKTGKRSRIVKEILMQNVYRNVYTFKAIL